MSESQTQPTRRRGFMLGAAVAGAATAAAVALPRTEGSETPTTENDTPPPAKGGGYRLSEHVKQYYKSTLV